MKVSGQVVDYKRCHCQRLRARDCNAKTVSEYDKIS